MNGEVVHINGTRADIDAAIMEQTNSQFAQAVADETKSGRAAPQFEPTATQRLQAAVIGLACINRDVIVRLASNYQIGESAAGEMLQTIADILALVSPRE